MKKYKNKINSIGGEKQYNVLKKHINPFLTNVRSLYPLKTSLVF